MKALRERRVHREKIERVVVRGANWVGDAVMTVPALRELRRALPRAHITLATRSWAEGIFDGADFIDDLLTVGAAGRGARALLSEMREWRRRRFDLALLFPNAFEPALVAALAHIPIRLGYATAGRAPLLTHAVGVPAWRGERHEVFYYLNLVAELERRLDEAVERAETTPQTELRVSPERRRAARELLARRGVNFTRPLVALCPGSTNSRAKRWPVASFAALADLLADESGAEVLLVGAPDERDVSEAVATRMRRRPLVLTGETELAQMVAVLSLADLLVTNDTGPAHIAAAVGCPVLVIFGPTNPATTRPFSDAAVVVRRPPDCAPCMLRDCPIDHRCMTAIAPADVLARARLMLDARARLEVAR